MTDTRPSFDDLLTHEPFVTTLARALVVDESAAADVTQEVWTAALRSPPRRTENLRGWLGTVTRNFARMRHRSESRRGLYEAARAPEAHAPSAAEVAARIEIRRKLVDAVDDLDEPYRTVVVLRYFDGLRPIDISPRLGVPAKTVNTRLRRACARLRDAFEAESGRSRARNLLPLIGALLMSAKAKVALVAAAVVLASVATWQIADRMDSERKPVAPVANPAQAPEVGTATVPEPVVTPEPRTESLPADPIMKTTLAVTVLDPEGNPVEKTRVSWFRDDGQDRDGAVTGKSGRVDLSISSGSGSLVVRPASIFSPQRREEVTVGEEITIRLTMGLSIQGSVIDRHGEPVPGCRVWARARPAISWLGRTYYREAMTDDKGQFVIRGLVRGRYRLVSFPQPLDGSQPDPSVEANTGDAGMKVLLGPLLAPVIRIVDAATGEPVAGRRSYFLLRDSSERHLGGQTLAGDFGMWRMPPEGTRLKVVADGYHPAEVDLPSAGSDLLLVVRLRKDPDWREELARLNLHVVDDTGAPLDRVKVIWRTPARGRVEVDLVEGRAVVELPPGDHRLQVTAKDHLPVTIPIVLGASEQASREVVLNRLGHVEVQLPPTRCEIKVLDSEGRPRKGWISTTQFRGGMKVSLPPGTYVLRVTEDGKDPIDRKVTIEPNRTGKVSMVE